MLLLLGDDMLETKWPIEQLKAGDNEIRKKTAFWLGNTCRISALTPLCNISLFDCDEGVRVVTVTAILEIARKNPKNMKITIKVATHPLLTSLQRFQTHSYARCIAWVLSQLDFSPEEREVLIDAIEQKRNTLTNSYSKNMASKIIEALKGDGHLPLGRDRF